jgi:hypothetical protein
VMHALQSVVLEVSGDSDREPCDRRKPKLLSFGPPPSSDEIRYFSLDRPTPAKPLNPRLF